MLFVVIRPDCERKRRCQIQKVINERDSFFVTLNSLPSLETRALLDHLFNGPNRLKCDGGEGDLELTR